MRRRAGDMGQATRFGGRIANFRRYCLLLTWEVAEGNAGDPRVELVGAWRRSGRDGVLVGGPPVAPVGKLGRLVGQYFVGWVEDR